MSAVLGPCSDPCTDASQGPRVWGTVAEMALLQQLIEEATGWALGHLETVTPQVTNPSHKESADTSLAAPQATATETEKDREPGGPTHGTQMARVDTGI